MKCLSSNFQLPLSGRYWMMSQKVLRYSLLNTNFCEDQVPMVCISVRGFSLFKQIHVFVIFVVLIWKILNICFRDIDTYNTWNLCVLREYQNENSGIQLAQKLEEYVLSQSYKAPFHHIWPHVALHFSTLGYSFQNMPITPWKQPPNCLSCFSSLIFFSQDWQDTLSVNTDTPCLETAASV